MVTVDNDDDGGSESVGKKKVNLRSFNFNRVYLDPLSKSNAVTFLKLPTKFFISGLFVVCHINNRSIPKIKNKINALINTRQNFRILVAQPKRMRNILTSLFYPRHH